MDDYEYPETESENEDSESQEKGPRLPGGLSVETAASGLLVIVIVALLWLFFGPQSGSDDESGLPTATATTASAPKSTAKVGRATPKSAIIPQPTKADSQVEAPAGTTPSVQPAGPTVPPAPSGVVEGAFVRVSNTDGMDLRFRFGPGVDTATIRIAAEGEIMKVVGGPDTTDGATWWRLQDMHGNFGWAAEDFLVPVAAPASWNPPAASPTFESQAGGSGAAASP